MNLYAIIDTISTVLILLTTICYFYQIVYLILPLFHRDDHRPVEKNTRYAILIAARNEEAVLPHLLDSISAQDYPGTVRTFVVADNCTDRTAPLAEKHGATVFQRFNKNQVGKGYALNYLLNRIDGAEGLDSFDAFLIFDADNLLPRDYIRRMNRVVSMDYDAFCGCRNAKNFDTNWLTAGYGLWYLHDSTHGNRSRMILGTPCTINGTGFGFTRDLLRRMGGWNFFTLTEDIEFTTWCATHSIRVGYCHDAMVYDEQPTRLSVSVRQRTRWVQGGLQVSFKYAGDLLRGILKGGRTGYASFETATQSLWGYGMGALSLGTALAAAYLAGKWLGLAQAVAASVCGAYLTFFLMGALTLLAEYRRIPAGMKGMLLALFGFPFFMLSYAPIALIALFKKFQWAPIEHTAAISVREI